MILVTGATGHLGNVLVRELTARGEKVRILVLPNESLRSLTGVLVEVITGDILDREVLRIAMRGVKKVFHLAGVIAIRPGYEDIMQRVNVEGTRNVTQAALEAGIEKLVHVSSIHAFRREPHGIFINENTPLALDSPAGSYDRTKAEGTKVVLDAVKQGLAAVVVCPTGIIGPHDYLRSEMGQTLASFAGRKTNFLVEGAFDFVDVHDVALGLILAGEKGRIGEIYILSGTQVTLKQLCEITQEAAVTRSSLITVPIRFALLVAHFIEHLYLVFKKHTRYTVYSLQTVIDNSAFSSQKAKQELGYSSRPLRESVENFLHWRKGHENLSPRKQQSRL